jgi:hypothetical protein
MKRIILITCLFAALGRFAHAQCPTFSCPGPGQTIQICDQQANNSSLWNEAYWLDNVTGLHDLAEAPSPLSLSVTDTCNPSSRRISYALLLDLDNDGVTETAVWSDSLPPGGQVRWGNASNPNYAGGALRSYDERPVPSNQKYRFDLETESSTQTMTARVRWTTAQAPSTFLDPQLPLGTHKIIWFIESGGVKDTCIRTITIRDCANPTVACQNGLSVNMLPTGTITLQALDFLSSGQDNVTPAFLLKYGIRKSGTGTGFPVDSIGNPVTHITYSCADLGTQIIELWSKDKAGNADYCEAYVIVQDNAGNCPGNNNPGAKVCTQTEDNNWIDGVEYEITGPQNIPNFTQVFQSGPDGCLHLNALPPTASNAIIRPFKDDNPLNGVTTYDLVLISKHILGIQPLGSLYKMIAADANKSGSITTFDIIELRKLILGIYTSFPNNTSWRFVNKDYVFPNPLNPFTATIPESKTIASIIGSNTGPDFIGVKVGDVNGSAIGNFAGDSGLESRDAVSNVLTMPDHTLQAGEILDVPIGVAQPVNWLGYQCAFKWDPDLIQVLELLPGEGMKADNYALFKDALSVSWSDAIPKWMIPGQPLFQLRIRALQTVQLNKAILLHPAFLKPESYPEDGERPNQLDFKCIEPVAFSEEQARIFDAMPNPTSGNAVLPLYLPEATTVRLELTDAAGRVMYSKEATCESGNSSLLLPTASMLQDGVYFWKAETGTIRKTGRIVHLK